MLLHSSVSDSHALEEGNSSDVYTQVNSSLMLHHNACSIHLTSSNHIVFCHLTSPQEEE